MQLTEYQSEIITGSMLGDGSIEKFYHGNTRFCESHGEKQLGWLQWKYDKLKPFSKQLKIRQQKAVTKLENGKLGRSNVKIETGYMFRTCKNKIFTALESQWYNKRMKILPPDIKLTPLALAVWYFDDGSTNYKDRTATISSHCFTYEECNRLKDMLANLNIKEVSVYKNSVIRVRPKQFLDFIKLINTAITDIPNCIRYKADISLYSAPWTPGCGQLRRPNSNFYSISFNKTRNKWSAKLHPYKWVGRFNTKEEATQAAKAMQRRMLETL